MKTKFHVFKIVANHLSFTKASEELFISQPAVSKTIRNLEESYNTTFFVRKKNSITLTSSGKIFLVYVDRILSIHSEIDNEFLIRDFFGPPDDKILNISPDRMGIKRFRTKLNK